jgi:cell division transport system ATP-binding protein
VIGRPSLLIADEPTARVDETQGVRILRLFEELNRIGTTVVVATHDQHLVDRFHHRVLRLEDGRITLERDGGASALTREAGRVATPL